MKYLWLVIVVCACAHTTTDNHEKVIRDWCSQCAPKHCYEVQTNTPNHRALVLECGE